MRTSRRACGATSSSCVITTSVRPSSLELVEERQHRLGVHGVEVAGRLVAQQQGGGAEQRARDRDALLLAARELRRQEVAAVAHADALERGLRRVLAGPSRSPPAYTSASITFSIAVWWPSRWKVWKTKPIRRARSDARCSSLRLAASMPSTR